MVFADGGVLGRLGYAEDGGRDHGQGARLTKSRMLRLRRRDADDLVLMSAERAEREGEVIDLTARLLGAMAQADPKAMAEALPRVLAWMKFLPAQEALDFANEFLATARAASSIDNLSAVSHVITAWRHTAEIYSDPELRKHSPVPR